MAFEKFIFLFVGFVSFEEQSSRKELRENFCKLSNENKLTVCKEIITDAKWGPRLKSMNIDVDRKFVTSQNDKIICKSMRVYFPKDLFRGLRWRKLYVNGYSCPKLGDHRRLILSEGD